MSRTFSLALVFFFLFGLVTSCENTSCGCDPAPAYSASDLLYTWRLDQVTIGGRITAWGEEIKDRYTVQFRADGTYLRTLLADNSTTAGTWRLTVQNTQLEITDHKGAVGTYLLDTVSSTTLVYNFINKDQFLEQLKFSRQ